MRVARIVLVGALFISFGVAFVPSASATCVDINKAGCLCVDELREAIAHRPCYCPSGGSGLWCPEPR